MPIVASMSLILQPYCQFIKNISMFTQRVSDLPPDEPQGGDKEIYIDDYSAHKFVSEQ